MNQIGVLGLHKIRDILYHMLFQTNTNVQNALHMKKRVHAKLREAFYRKEKKRTEKKRKLDEITNAQYEGSIIFFFISSLFLIKKNIVMSWNKSTITKFITFPYLISYT